ncbi:VOC family protein [Nocardia rhamnosiphila]|uniref:VOC family protein n=1 Tax=Nocardia rhamnosiphila TaxID=426716 RepID=A0ABV2X0U4_9NOCA
MADGQIRQIAFVVPDAEAAAKRHSALLGSGPYFIVPHYELVVHRYRGQDGPIDVTSAYGQWGDVMIEFVQIHGEAPSAYRDTFPTGGPGMHHVAVFCDNRAEAVAEFEKAGYIEALYAEAAPGRGYSIMDTSADLGFMVELYEERMVAPFYQMVREAAADFDGTDPVRLFDLAIVTKNGQAS